jgi:hypothetical protein
VLVLNGEFPTLLCCEHLAVTPPRGYRQEPQKFRQANRDQRRTTFGIRIEDGTLLAALTTEEEGPSSTVACESLQRIARGEMNILAVVTSVQVEVARPGQETSSIIPLTDCSDQRLHAQHPNDTR